MADVVKQVYVDVAFEEFGLPGRKQTTSRVSVITGLSRKEVARLRRLNRRNDQETRQQYNRAARVISAWVREAEFHDANGQPAPLPVEGDQTSFGALVRRYSGDMPVRAILDELLRVRAVERLEDGRIRLLARSYVPAAGEVEKLGILGTDVADLIATIDWNLRHPSAESYFQRKVQYDNLPSEVMSGAAHSGPRTCPGRHRAARPLDGSTRPGCESYCTRHREKARHVGDLLF